jgi:LPS export ABC transporter protein LptC
MLAFESYEEVSVALNAKSLVLALAVTLLGVVIYKTAETLWRQRMNEFKENPFKLLDSLPEGALEVKDFHRTQIKDGRKLWEVSGEEIRYLKKEKEAVIKKPRVVFYHEDGDALEVQGDEGRLFFDGQEMERVQLQGEMEVKYSGYVLRANELLYVKGEDRVVLPGKVSVKGKGLELEGVGMEISLRDEKLQLHQKVKTRFEPESLRQKETKRTHVKKASIP